MRGKEFMAIYFGEWVNLTADLEKSSTSIDIPAPFSLQPLSQIPTISLMVH